MQRSFAQVDVFSLTPYLGNPVAVILDGEDLAGEAMQRGRVVQECGAGLVEVRRGDGMLSFAAPPTHRDGDIEEEYLERIVGAFGIDRDRVLAHQWVDNGPRAGGARPGTGPVPDTDRDGRRDRRLPGGVGARVRDAHVRARSRDCRGPRLRQHERLRRAMA